MILRLVLLCRLLSTFVCATSQPSCSGGSCIAAVCYKKFSTVQNINLTCGSNAVLSVNAVFFGAFARTRHCPTFCCEPVHNDNGCMKALTSSHVYMINITSQCNGKSQCLFAARQESRRFDCTGFNDATLPSDYVFIHYFCNPQLTSSTTMRSTSPMTVTPAMGLQQTNSQISNNLTSRFAAIVSTSASQPKGQLTDTPAASIAASSVWQLQISIRDVVTAAVGALLVLIIIVLTAILCRRKYKSRDMADGQGSSRAAVNGSRRRSAANFYDLSNSLAVESCSDPPLSPLYAIVPAAEWTSPPADPKNTSIYLPMQGNKNRSDSQLDAYVFEDSSFGGYSMAYDAIPPPLPPLTAQQHDAADYLQPLTSNTLRKSTRQSKTNLLPLPSNPRIASIRGSGSQSDHVDYVDGALYSDAKLEPFRVRQKSADIWTPRRSKQPPSRYRPASMQLLQPAGGGTFEYEADLQQYEEIPANFGTLPKSQPEKSMKWRPPAPPPVATPPLEPLRMTFPSHTLPSQADGTRRQCSSADGVLLSTVDKLSVDEWAQSTLHQDGGVRKNDCTVDQEVERAVSSMTRKGSYEEDSIILIDSDIYSGCKQTDNRTMT